MNQAPITRATLLLRLRDPADNEAWDTFTQDYAPALYRFLRRRGLQDADAADLLQEVMRSVGLAIKDWDYEKQRGGFRAWLFTITRNRLYNHLEKGKKKRGDAQGTAAVNIINQTEQDNELESDWELEHQTQLLGRAMSEILPKTEPKTWEAFRQTAIEGRSAAEVAQGLGMSTGSVYVARSRVTAKLRERVQELEREQG
ncbi:MAG: RNA polymerase sigma factor [Planctomycetota bacterium]